jgi:putative membrane protein
MPRALSLAVPIPPLAQILPVALALALTAPHAHAQPSPARAISPRTTDFIAKLAATDAFERDAGRLAEKRSGDADIRAFGGMMVKDHTQTTDDLRQVLVKDHLPVPQSPTPNPIQAKMMSDLAAAPKGSFDRAYVQSQVTAHQQALAAIQDYQMNGDNPDLKALAGKAAPLVQHHLDMAVKLEPQVGGPPKSLTRKED